jgi:hypothetical protein
MLISCRNENSSNVFFSEDKKTALIENDTSYFLFRGSGLGVLKVSKIRSEVDYLFNWLGCYPGTNKEKTKINLSINKQPREISFFHTDSCVSRVLSESFSEGFSNSKTESVVYSLSI